MRTPSRPATRERRRRCRKTCPLSSLQPPVFTPATNLTIRTALPGRGISASSGLPNSRSAAEACRINAPARARCTDKAYEQHHPTISEGKVRKRGINLMRRSRACFGSRGRFLAVPMRVWQIPFDSRSRWTSPGCLRNTPAWRSVIQLHWPRKLTLNWPMRERAVAYREPSHLLVDGSGRYVNIELGPLATHSACPRRAYATITRDY
jgi:hypothetical protein